MKDRASRINRRYRQLRQELQAGFAALAGVFLLGTCWYWLEEGWTLIEAAYMTTITLATVGFSEVRPLDEDGRLFTICLIFLGLLTIAYIVNRFTEAVIQGYFQEGIRQRRERRMIDLLENHYILCGYGRTGRQVAIELQAEDVPFVLIDAGLEEVEQAQELGFIAIAGDATLDESLLMAGIERATCLIAALTSDAENLYTVLSAKALNPQIRAIARASTEEALTKLQRAGADAVISPYISGGKRLAAAALRPQVMDFVDGILTGTDSSLYMEEYLLEPDISVCIGQTLSDARLRSQSGILVLAIRRASGHLIASPTGDTELMAGDSLICMGTAEQLRLLNQILDPLHADRLRLPKQQ